MFIVLSDPWEDFLRTILAVLMRWEHLGSVAECCSFFGVSGQLRHLKEKVEQQFSTGLVCPSLGYLVFEQWCWFLL